MKFAVLGDIHANLSALTTVLGAIDGLEVDVVLSVGDVVGYGAAPSECIALLRERGVVVVKGNHDAAVVDELDIRYFNNYARAAVEWTRGFLSPAELDWLRALPMTVQQPGCQVAHGSLDHPEAFNYVQTAADGNPSLDVMDEPVCFVGHTHLPVVLWRPKKAPKRTEYWFESRFDTSPAERSLVNVGSVGQPRDENPQTAFAYFDQESGVVEIRRLEYDVEREAARIRTAGLPAVLADRLFLGI